MDIRKFFSKKKIGSEDIVQISSEPSTSTSLLNRLDEIDNTNKENIQNFLIPGDLPRKGEPIKQIRLHNYPKRNSRSFQVEWFSKFQWLQYSRERDAAFCYACMQFETPGNKEKVFTKSGFQSWKHALDARGFPRHEQSLHHLQAMALWQEKMHRTDTSQSISTLISSNVLEKNRYYIKSIAEIIQFLVVNELALRGHFNIEDYEERGLFKNLFEYTLKKDKYLLECQLQIPKNATYTSPEIQNEIITVITEIVRENIVQEINSADVNWFTLLEDGTRDKNNRENISIAIRYVKEGKVKESLLILTTTKKLDAETFTRETLKVLKENNLNTDYLLSQCYDGASVMSGKVGGVSTRIQKAVKRIVPYVHCFNHRLHLIIIRTISEITILRHFFDQCVTLYEFFHHAKVAELYEGKTIVRLLEQRWSGHLAATKVILSNYNEILKTLEEIPKKKFSGDDVAKSVGLLNVMKKLDFRFAMVLANKILLMLEPADAALQSRSILLHEAVEITKSAANQLTEIRTNEDFMILMNAATSLLPNYEDIEESKKRKKPKIFKDFIEMETLPSTSRSSEEVDSIKDSCKMLYFETLDILLSELKRRFDNNDKLIEAISDINKFDLNKLKYLSELGKIFISRLCLDNIIFKYFFKELICLQKKN